MRTNIRNTVTTLLRMTALVSFLVGPVGAFAYAQTGDKGPGLSGAGYVLYVSLQRNSK
ncbi:hypothetical protein SAMN05877838_0676 [Hoeflea halophila]|uniref:Uncharacterized protein n=1 Tax=Hoeflea halophila TaxID=714899 RepID=A0A286HMY7_9HYPH|nr:hypothetical protein [Hoeflea halophila]SOE09158.1 hypothetical protein SAMN05877838_0676 [Hoeflea halophila]